MRDQNPNTAHRSARVRLGVAAVSTAAVFAGALAAQGQAFQSDITRWITQDALSPRDPGAVLFVGSSSIRRWELLANDFADYRILQRGFGGSQLEHLNFFVGDIVVPYQPSVIVVWCGTNDLATGESAAEVFADYQQFVSLVHAQLPAVTILYLGVTPTPSNGNIDAIRRDANMLIESFSEGDARLGYVDLPAAFEALNPPNDPAFTSLYVDGVHVNRAGYAVWTSIVRPAVEAVLAPNKVFVANPLTLTAGDRVLFDFGPSNPEDGRHTASPDGNGLYWNNWHPAEGNEPVNAGEHIDGLVDVSGEPTGLELTITGGFSTNGRVNGGLLAPNAALLGDLAVPTATEDYFFSGADDLVGGGNDDIPGGFMLSGLDPARVYELRFFGSRTTAEQTRITEYTARGANTVITQLQTTGSNIGSDGFYDGNDSVVAVAGGVRPDAFGQIFVDLQVAAGNFAYLNAFELRVVAVSFAQHPASIIADAGGELSFAAIVEGSPDALRWERDGIELSDDARIAGSSTSALVIVGARAEDAGEYRLVATVGPDEVVSGPAVGAVRGSPLGVADFNNDSDLNELDIIEFMSFFEASLP